MSARSPWIDRIGGALVGGGLVLLVRGREVPPASPAPVPVAPAHAAAPTGPDPVALGQVHADLEPTPPSAPDDTPPPAPTIDRDASALEPVNASRGDEDDPASPPPPDADAPELPLPRMPGTRTLHRNARLDPETGSWVLSHTVQVPAPASQVESFYRKALEGVGHEVKVAVEPIDDRYAVRLTLRGRSREDKAQISVRQPAGEMRTTARIIWQKLR